MKISAGWVIFGPQKVILNGLPQTAQGRSSPTDLDGDGDNGRPVGF